MKSLIVAYQARDPAVPDMPIMAKTTENAGPLIPRNRMENVINRYNSQTFHPKGRPKHRLPLWLAKCQILSICLTSALLNRIRSSNEYDPISPCSLQSDHPPDHSSE